MRAQSAHQRYSSLSWLIVTMTIVALVIGAIALRHIESRLVASKGESLALAAAEIAHKLDLLLAEQYDDALELSRTHLFRKRDGAAQSAYLGTVKNIHPIYLWLGVTDAGGRIVAATNPASVGLDRSRSSWFQAARNTGGVHVGDVEPFEEVGGVDAISFTAPITGAGGEFQGTVTMQAGLPTLEDVVARTIRTFQVREEPRGNLEYKFMTSTGAVFIDSDLFHKGNVNLKQLGLPSVLLSESGRPGYFEEEHLQRHVQVITGYARTQGTGEFPGLKWTVLLRNDKSDLVAPIRSMLWKLASAWVLVWLPMLAFSLWSTRRLKKEWAHAQTEQAHAAAAESNYRQLVEQAGDIIYRVDLSGRFTYVNSTVSRVKGYAPEELIGRHFTEHIRADARDSARRFYARQFARRTSSTYYEFPATRKDGREIWLGQNVEILIENGQVVGFQAVARDITERKRAEEALTASEMQMRLFMEATADCIWSWDLAVNRIARSVGFQRLFGYAAEEIVPTIDWWADRLHPDDRERVWAIFEDAVASGRTTCSYEYRFRRRDGSYAIIDDRAFIVRDVTGKVVRTLGAMTDITERKRAEEALLASISQLDEAQRIARLGSWDWNITNNLEVWSDEQFRIFGFEPRSFQPTYEIFLNALHPDDHSRVMDAVEQALKGTSPYEVECRIRRPNGEVRAVICHGEVHRSAEGKPVRMVGTVLDITDRKRAETALRTTTEFLQALVQTSPLAIINLDSNGNVTSWNRAAEEMLGWSESEVLGKPLPYVPSDKQAESDRLWDEAKRNSGLRGVEIRRLRKDGTPIDLELWSRTFRNEQGMPTLLVGILADITERKRAEEALAASEKRLRAILEAEPECVKVTTEDGILLDMNVAGLAMIEADSLEQVRNQSVCPLIAPDHRDAFSDFNRRVYHGEPGTLQFEIVGLKGTRRRMDTHAVPLRNERGETVGVLAVTRDITERKQIEEKLLLSQEIIANANDPISIMDLQGRFTYQNHAHASLVGFSDDELLGKTPALFLGEEPFALICKELAQTQSYRGEVIAHTKDGALKDLDLSVFSIRDAAGKPTCFVAIKRDITERKQAEAEIQRARSFLGSIVENIPDMIFVKDAKDLRFVQLNKAGEQLLGYPRQDLIGKNDYDFFPKEEADFFTAKDRTALENGSLMDILEEPIATRHQGTRFLHTKKIPILDNKGRPQYLLGISEDITERKRTEETQRKLIEELAESRNRFKMLFRQTPSPISITTIKEGRFVDVNKQAEILTGYLREELLGRTTLEMNLYVDPTDRDKIVQQLKKTGVLTDLERQIRTKSGEIRTAIFSLVPVQMGTEPCLLAIAHDITERKRAEQALRQRSLQQAIEAELSLLAATVQDQSSLLNTAAKLVLNALEVDYCEALELLPNNSELRLCASAGWKGDCIGQVRAAETGSLAHAALQSGKPVVQTLPDNRQFGGPPWLHKHGTVAGMSVSVPCKDRSWGVLGVYTAGARAFSRDDINFLQTVASTLATAIERMQAERVLTSANQALRLLSQQLLQVQENERRTIARDLHDEIGQSLTAIKLNVERAQRVSEPAAKARIMQDCAQIAERVLAQVRNLSLDLHPSILDDLGLPYALKWFAGRLAEQAGLKVEVAADTSLPRLSQDIEIACFRIAQEALTNVVRHARATQVGIVLKRGAAAVELCVQDDGIGFVPDNIASPINGETSVGLASMQERAKLLGGTVKIASAPRCGTKVIATLPLLVASPADVPIEEVPRS